MSNQFRQVRAKHDDATLEPGVLETERFEVADGLVPRAPDGLVRRVDAHRRQPAVG